MSIANRLDILKVGAKIRIVRSSLLSVSVGEQITIIGISAYDILLGWKTNDNKSKFTSVLLTYFKKNYECVVNIEQFNNFFQLGINTLHLEYELVTETKSFGCTCVSCNTYYPDAEQQPNFSCWSCKNYH